MLKALCRRGRSYWGDLNLRKKLSVVFVAMAMLPLLVAAGITEWETAKVMKNIVFQRNKELALNVAHDVDQLFAEKIRLMKVVASDPAFRSMRTAQQTMILQQMGRNYDGIYFAAIADPSGRQTARSDGLEVEPAIDYSERAYFQTTIRNRTTTVSDVLTSKSAGWTGVVIAEPIIGEDDSVRGMFLVNIGIYSIHRLIAEATANQQATVYIVNKKGETMVSSGSAPSTGTEKICREPVQKALAGETGWLEYECGGQKVLAGHSYLPNTGWGLVAEQNLDAALAEVNAAHKLNLFIIVASILLAILTSLSIAQTIAVVIGQISQASLKVAAGDFKTRLQVERKDELGILADNFNQMTEQLALRSEALVASEEKFHSLVDHINIGVYQATTSEDGQFLQINPAMVEIFDYPSAAELLATPVTMLYHNPVDRQLLLQRLEQSGYVKNREVLMRKFDGSPIWCSRSVVLRRDATGTVQWMDGVVEDITERKLAEETLRQARDDLEVQVAERTRELTLLNEELHRRSLSDGLTGLANRRSLDEFLAREWKRAQREQISMAAIMIDIDFFKQFNDTYGHLAGDECLKQVADCLRTMIHRPTDFVARYGGEEFAVLLPGTEAEGALLVGENIRLAIEALKMANERSPLDGKLTVSAGVVAMVPTLELEPEELLNLADQALYKAKQSGRNQVRVSGDERGQGS